MITSGTATRGSWTIMIGIPRTDFWLDACFIPLFFFEGRFLFFYSIHRAFFQSQEVVLKGVCTKNEICIFLPRQAGERILVYRVLQGQIQLWLAYLEVEDEEI